VTLLQENVGKTLDDIGLGNYFLDGTPITQERKTGIDKRDYIKLKSFCTSKESYHHQETIHGMGENL
jgi:hypothetical protein